MADVPPEVRARLESGVEETRTLAEILVIDFGKLLNAVAPECGREVCAALSIRDGVLTRMARGGQALLDRFGPPAFERFRAHPSDTVRGWAAYALAQTPKLTLAQRYRQIEPLADDPNSGVREWAWIALRPHVLADLKGAIKLGGPWVAGSKANLRRFAVEVIRPRGVWCAHCPELKSNPELGLPLLEPLKGEPHKYVQDSVANWLNDAGKSRPEFVQELCRRWLRQSAAPATERICRRALRSL